MAKKKTDKPIKEDEISVAERTALRYTESEKTLKEFMTDRSVLETLREFYRLIEERNRSLDEAVRAIKSELQRSEHGRMVLEGIGAQKRWKRYYDAEFLSEHLPGNQASMILTEKIVHEINLPLLEQLLRQGEIDNTVVREAYHEEEQSPAVLPGTPKEWSLPPLPVDQ